MAYRHEKDVDHDGDLDPLFHFAGNGAAIRTVPGGGGEPDPGRHTLEWRGRDQAGRAAPSGVYVFRVVAGGQVEVRRAMLLQ